MSSKPMIKAFGWGGWFRPQDRVMKVFSVVVLGACLIIAAIPDTAWADYEADVNASDIDQRLLALCPNADCYSLSILGTYLLGDQDTGGLAGFETLDDLLYNWNRAAGTTLLGDVGNGEFVDAGTVASVRAGWDEKQGNTYAQAAHIPSPATFWLMGSVGVMLLFRKPGYGR